MVKDEFLPGRRAARRPARGARHRRLLPVAWPATTTTCRGRRWSRCADGGPRRASCAGRPRTTCWPLDVGVSGHGSADAIRRSPCSAAARSAAQVVRLLHEQADDLDRAGRRPARAGRRRRAPPRRDRATLDGRPDGLLTTDAARPGRPRRRRRRRRGDRRHRAGPHADPGRRCEQRQERGHRQQGAAGRGRRRRCFEAADEGRRATSTTRPPSPARSRCCGRCASRCAGDRITRVLGIVNGTTNFILDKMDTTGAGFAEALEEATAARLRRGRPDRRRRGLRRRRQGRDPGLARLPHPGHRRRRAPRGHHRGDRRRRRVGAKRDGLRRQAARASASSRLRDGAVGRVRVHPAMIPRSHPLAERPRRLQRGLRRGRGRRPADVLRPGRRRRADRQRGARRPRRGGPQPARRRPAAPASRRTPTCRCCRWARRVTRYHVRIDVDDRAGVLAAVATAFAEHGVLDPDRAPGGPRRRRPAGRGHPPRHRRRSWRATVEDLRATGHRPRGHRR